MVNANTGFTRSLVTEASGSARLAALPPGEYEAKFDLSGFAPISRQIILRVGEVGRIEVVMRVAGRV